MKLYPLKFDPIFHYRIWGGERLKTVLGKKYSGESIGESWEISTVPNNVSKVDNGEFKDRDLLSLIDEFGEDLLGKKVVKKYGLNFPLLIKFIDAAKPLSVQVHPNDELAKERHSSFGKTEMWYVMDATDDAQNIIGFQEGVGRKEYEEAIENDDFDSIMQTVSVEKEDVFFLPAGRVHAIGANILLAEIQQTSDVTYRIYDYNRIDKDGKKRELHTDLAKDAINFSFIEEPITKYKSIKNIENEVVNCPFFNTKLLSINQDYLLDNTEDSFQILICVDGKAQLANNKEDLKVEIKKGETVLVPASLQKLKILPKEDSKILSVTV